MTRYLAAPDRYTRIPYRRTGRSGLQLPALSLGLWHNFGDTTPLSTQRELLRTAFDLGINHFDLAQALGIAVLLVSALFLIVGSLIMPGGPGA